MRKIAFTFLGLFSLAGAAKALGFVPFIISVGVHLAAAFGLTYAYMVKPVATPAGSIKVVLKTTDSVSDSQIEDAQGAVESARDIEPTGPFWTTVTCPSAQCKRSSNYTLSGATVEALLDALATCPSDVCLFGGNVPNWWGPAHRGYVTGVKGLFNDAFSPPQARVTWKLASGSTVTSDFRTDTVRCSTGYVLNKATSKCDLANIQEARDSGGRDGVCIVSHGAPDGADLDCQYMQQTGYMSTGTASNGGQATAATDPATNMTVAQTASPDGGTVVSVTQPSADGGRVREDTYVSPSGQVGTTDSTNYPTSPPPSYPGDSGGGGGSIGYPGSGTNGGTPCGAPGQSPCAIKADGNGLKIDSEGRGESDLPDGESQSSGFEPTSTFLDPVKDKLSGFFDFQLPSHASQCPALDISWSAWNLGFDAHSNFMCDWLEQNRALIQSLVAFAYLAMAIIIVLGA